MKINIRLIYLYLFSFVGLLITVVGAIRMVELGLKVFVFKGADQYSFYPAPKMISPDGRVASDSGTLDVEEQKRMSEEEQSRQRQREFSGALAMMVVGVPLYAYHWKTIQKENRA